MKPLRIFTSVLLAGVCAALASTVHAAPKVKAKAPPQGKPYLIHAGWVGPSLEFLKEHVEEVEAQAPFDGYLFGMDVTCPMYNQKIEINEQVKNKIKLYKQIKFKRATHNFLSIMIDQAKPDWFDDKYWKTVAENFAVVAKVVAMTDMEGVAWDTECYGVYPVNSYWTSAYFIKEEEKKAKKSVVRRPANRKGAKAENGVHTPEEYRAIARERGRQLGAAMYKECPNLKLWVYYLWSYKSDLMGAFCNGLLETMPDTARLIDGDEWRGYCMADENGYKPMAEDNRKGYGQLDSKLVQKHRKVGGVAPAFYLDFYADPKSTLYEWQPRKNYEGNPARLLKRQLREAKRNATGGHIWIYGEKGQFWDWTKFKKGKATMANRFPMWEEKIPGIRKAIFGNEYQDPDVDHKGRVLPDMSYYISDTMSISADPCVPEEVKS